MNATTSVKFAKAVKFALLMNKPQFLVFKFGGASVKSAEAIENVAHILKQYPQKNIVVVISAIGKTTNAFEGVWRHLIAKKPQVAKAQFEEIWNDHQAIVQSLFASTPPVLAAKLKNYREQIETLISGGNAAQPDYLYDQLVSFGELFSTTIIAAYLQETGIENQWFDARSIIKTDYAYRHGNVDWVKTKAQVLKNILPYFTQGEGQCAITQGFIGGADALNTTTLGREGSDYSAAILAYSLDADAIYIWKDVPGVLNADPKLFDNVAKRDEISYKEAIELAYYGASVIHPKTVKPLQNKSIPLWVKSFVQPELPGTLIHENSTRDAEMPAFITKANQRLLSLATKDFSFIVEEHLSEIFHLFAQHKASINMMQNSAINFSVAVDDVPERLNPLIEALHRNYAVRFNSGLELLTIRHYNETIIKQLTSGRQKLMEQRTRHTYRVVMK